MVQKAGVILLNLEKTGNMKTSLLFSFLVLSIIAYCQDPEVSLSIDPVSADVGEIITITIKSNVQGNVEIDNLPSSFVQGYDVMSGMEQEMDVNSGRVITYYYVSQTGVIGAKGKYTIGPAFVKKGNKTIQSNTVKVEIGEKTEMTNLFVTDEQLKEPAFGIIQTNKKVIYEGEPIIISAKIYSHFEPTHLEGYRTYNLPGTIDRSKLGNSKRIVVEEEFFKNYKLFSFEYDKNIIFPDVIGAFKIESYSMKLNQNYKGYQFKSNNALVEVKPLPEDPPTEFIGGVGHFTIEGKIEGDALKQGDVFKMFISIIGAGNLHNIIEPTPKLPKGFIVYGDPEIEEEYIFNSKGTEGKINYKYNIQVNKAGKTTLPPTIVAFFDPKKEKYISIATTSTELNIKADENYVNTVEELESDNIEPEEQDYLRQSRVNNQSNSFFGSGSFWLGVSAPLFLALIFLFISKRKEDSVEKVMLKTATRNNQKQLSLLLAELEIEKNSNNSNLFFSNVEESLKIALALKLGINPSDNLSKQILIKNISLQVQPSILQKVKSIFEKCDEFRYGFGADNHSKNEIIEELNHLVKTLK